MLFRFWDQHWQKLWDILLTYIHCLEKKYTNSSANYPRSFSSHLFLRNDVMAKASTVQNFTLYCLPLCYLGRLPVERHPMNTLKSMDKHRSFHHIVWRKKIIQSYTHMYTKKLPPIYSSYISGYNITHINTLNSELTVVSQACVHGTICSYQTDQENMVVLYVDQLLLLPKQKHTDSDLDQSHLHFNNVYNLSNIKYHIW